MSSVIKLTFNQFRSRRAIRLSTNLLIWRENVSLQLSFLASERNAMILPEH